MAKWLAIRWWLRERLAIAIRYLLTGDQRMMRLQQYAREQGMAKIN